MDAASTSDAFDGSAEPIIYMSDNRMPVMVELSSTVIYIIFVSLLLALLFILPGIRQTKLTSFLGLISLLTVGATILLSIEGSHWLTGSVRLHDSPYSSLTRDTLTGRLDVNIGLSSANVTLTGKLSNSEASALSKNNTNHPGNRLVDYNERFHWDKPERMADEHLDALRRGLPYPILTVTEFLSQDSDGFNWARKLRQAGYYTCLALYTCLASWCLMAFSMCALPVYLPHMMQITGMLLLSSVWIYTFLIQSPKSFAFQLGGSPVEFAFGYTYVATFIAGAVSMFSGMLLFVLQLSHPHEQFTIMDSEQYVNDQKALYKSNLANHSTGIKSIINSLTTNDNKSNHLNTKKPKALNRADSVIIPISDIEAHFKPTEPQAKSG